MRSRILVIARDVGLRARLARLLKAAGHAVELAESAAHARRIGLQGFAVAVVASDDGEAAPGHARINAEDGALEHLFAAV